MMTPIRMNILLLLLLCHYEHVPNVCHCVIIIAKKKKKYNIYVLLLLTIIDRLLLLSLCGTRSCGFCRD